MRSTIFLLLVLLAAVAAGVAVAKDPGYALFSYRDWAVEMPLWLAFSLALFVLMIFYVLIKMIENLRLYGSAVSSWNRQRQRNYAHKMLCHGLIELIEGRWCEAEKSLTRKVRRSDTSLVNYIMAAKAAHAQRKYDKRDEYLRLAHQHNPEAKIAIGLTQAHLQMDQKQLEQALATLKQLQRYSPRHACIIKALYQVNLELKDWSQLRELMPKIEKLNLLNVDQIRDLEKLVHQRLLQDAVHIDELLKLWSGVARRIKKEAVVILAFSQKLIAFGEQHQAEKILRENLSYAWDDRLALAYLNLEENAERQLKAAEGWQKSDKKNAVLLLLLAVFSERLQIWGKAKNYYEASLQLSPDSFTYQLYAEFLRLRGDKALALAKSIEGLRHLNAKARNSTL